MTIPAADAAQWPHTLEHLGLDTFERSCLPILRHFCEAHANPNTQAWHRAFILAVECWGETLGLAAAHLLSKYMRAVLKARADGFSFQDPLDIDKRGFVTEDEAHLLTVLHHMRRDQTGSARDAVADLTLGQMDPYVIRAGLTFAARFSKGAPVNNHAQKGAALRVVGGAENS